MFQVLRSKIRKLSPFQLICKINFVKSHEFTQVFIDGNIWMKFVRLCLKYSPFKGRISFLLVTKVFYSRSQLSKIRNLHVKVLSLLPHLPPENSQEEVVQTVVQERMLLMPMSVTDVYLWNVFQGVLAYIEHVLQIPIQHSSEKYYRFVEIFFN